MFLSGYFFLAGSFICFVNLFFTNRRERRGRRVERRIEEKREMLKKIFAMARIVSWELETPESFQKFISERRANRSKFV